MSLMGAQMVFICFYLWEKKWKCKNESKVKNLFFISNTSHVIFFFPFILFPFSFFLSFFLVWILSFLFLLHLQLHFLFIEINNKNKKHTENIFNSKFSMCFNTFCTFRTALFRLFYAKARIWSASWSYNHSVYSFTSSFRMFIFIDYIA